VVNQGRSVIVDSARTPSAIQRMDPPIGVHNASGRMSWVFKENDVAVLRAREAL
jgi:hypothetical protein